MVCFSRNSSTSVANGAMFSVVLLRAVCWSSRWTDLVDHGVPLHENLLHSALYRVHYPVRVLRFPHVCASLIRWEPGLEM